jgi:hypothetical protein
VSPRTLTVNFGGSFAEQRWFFIHIPSHVYVIAEKSRTVDLAVKQC